jgi:hypothetical protein
MRSFIVLSIAVTVPLALSIAACSFPTSSKEPGAAYDLSAQAYPNGVHVYARRDVEFGADAGPLPALSASIGGSTKPMGPLTADFPVTGGAFTAQIADSKGGIATIDVPAAFRATPEQATLHEGEHLKVTLAPAPPDGAKVTLRALPSECMLLRYGDVITQPLSADAAAAEFDVEEYFHSMRRPECDMSFGVRYETTGQMGDGYAGQAVGLREVTVTVHLVNPSVKLAAPTDAGAD